MATQTRAGPSLNGITRKRKAEKQAVTQDAHAPTKGKTRINLGWDHNPLLANGADCREDHYFRGLRLPPVGTCLEEIVKYLSGYKVYKSKEWPERAEFIEAHLDFLEEVPPKDGYGADRYVEDAGLLLSRDLQPAYLAPVYGRNTHFLIQEARRLLRIHTLFAEHEGNKIESATVFRSPSAVTTASQRPLRRSNLVSNPEDFEASLMSMVTRTTQPKVNFGSNWLPTVAVADERDILGMGRHYPDAAKFLNQMAIDDGKLIGQPGKPNEAIDSVLARAKRAIAAAENGGQNLAFQENAEYHKNVQKKRGWVTTSTDEKGLAVRKLPDNTVLDDDAVSYARERGARRAALQLALSQFSSVENTIAARDSKWRRVVLPTPAENTIVSVEKAGSSWKLLSEQTPEVESGEAATVSTFLPEVWQAAMDASRKDTTNESELFIISEQTHPFTFYANEYRRHRAHWMEEARKSAEAKNKDNPDWAMLPKFPDAYCIGYGIAPLPRAMENDRKMLGMLCSIARLLERALLVAPRPLLKDVLKYTVQGLSDFEAPDDKLSLRDAYDWQTKAVTGTDGRKRTRAVRALGEAEARWLKFLLIGSTNEQMMLPLPVGADLREPFEMYDEESDEKDEEDQGDQGDLDDKSDKKDKEELDEDGQALYECFARRLQGLMDDLSTKRLFKAVDTQVPIKLLVDTLNRDPEKPITYRTALFGAATREKETDGDQPLQRTRFSYGDARFFCDRLDKAGRCRFSTSTYSVANSRGGGMVRRPILTLHPEHRIWSEDRTPGYSNEPSWLAQKPSTANEKDPELAIGAPRRALEVDSDWAATVASGRAKKALRDEVRTFFCALAFRFGRTLHQLDTVERTKWETALKTAAAAPAEGKSRAEAAMGEWQKEYEMLTAKQHINCGLVDIVHCAHPTAIMQNGGTMTTEQAREIVSHNLLIEAEAAETPLPTTAEPRPTGPLWDWALPEVCGTAPQFFSMDYWPLHLQSSDDVMPWKRQQTLLDPEVVWDPASEDPAPAKYMWEPTEPEFGFQKVKRYAGDMHFTHGESKLQKQMVIEEITSRVATALGNVEENGMWTRLAARLPFFRWSWSEEAIGEELALPNVAESSIPQSTER